MSEVYEPYCCGGEGAEKEKIEEKGKDGAVARARLLTVYIEEAHATDEWFLPDAVDLPEVGGQTGAAAPRIAVHRSVDDRLAAARQLVADKGLRGLVAVDSMDNQVADQYFAWPERLYIILDGRVVYKGGMGPNDYRIEEVVQWLRDRYGEWGDEDEDEEDGEES